MIWPENSLHHHVTSHTKRENKMDSRKFDELTKILATNTSRRQALKTILASVVSGAFGLGGINEALAKPACYNIHHRCSHDSDCCSHNCPYGYCVKVPCYGFGESCSSNSDCCSNNCQNGYCGDPCSEFGESCSSNSDCCSNNCHNGYCDKHQCYGSRKSCSSNSDCCSNNCHKGTCQ